MSSLHLGSTPLITCTGHPAYSARRSFSEVEAEEGPPCYARMPVYNPTFYARQETSDIIARVRDARQQDTKFIVGSNLTGLNGVNHFLIFMRSNKNHEKDPIA